MADVQAENGYTRIANELLEAITRYKFNGTQLKIVMAVIRYTYGFSRKDAELSLVYLSKATGVDKRNLRREINVLIADKVLTVTKEATFTQSRMFRINKDYEEWKLNDPQWEALPTGGEITLPPEGELTHSPEGEITHSPGGELTPQERKINKALKKDINKDAINDLFESVWKLYPNKKSKTAVTAKAKKELQKYSYEEIARAIERYEYEVNNCGYERPYLHGSTFFNGRYIDYLDENFEQVAKPNNKKEDAIFKMIKGEINEQRRNSEVNRDDQRCLPVADEWPF
jgi:phage replication O-like protein O